MIAVRLESWERDWAAEVGRRRVAANERKSDALHYRRDLMEDDTRASIAAATCELAVAKYLNRYWSGSVWPAADHARHAADPDIAPDVEVRRVRARGNPLAVRRRDAERDRLMVLAFAVPDDFAVVEVVGWCRAREVWDSSVPAAWDRTNTTRLVPHGLLHGFAATGAA